VARTHRTPPLDGAPRGLRPLGPDLASPRGAAVDRVGTSTRAE
jgi:hypothetical protein